MKESTIHVTDAECCFVDHFNHESFNHYSGPAVSWLNDRDLDWKLMSVFQRWVVLHDPDFMKKIDGEEPIPPFEVPWSSGEELFSRVRELLEVYPDLKPLVNSSTKVGASA